MALFNLNDLKDQLNDASKNSAGSGVSIAKKSLKLDFEKDALELVKEILACPNLEYLDLEGNTLGPLAAKALGEALKVKGSALKRALWKDMFTGRLKEEIPEALESLCTALCTANTRLVELDLSDNAFGPIGVERLVSFLSSSSCYTLRELRLNNNGLGISGGKMLAKALLDCHDNSSKAGHPLALKVFVAGRNRLENEGAQALAAVFEKLTSLEEVVMPQNGIYYVGITALANGLSANPGLRILNLNDNTIGIKGAKALAIALPNFRNLEQLNLGDCLLKTDGSLILAEALAIEGNHAKLTEVNLSTNEIYTRGAELIALAMADKERLVSLQLNGNSFGTEGRAILRKSLAQSKKIVSLSSLSDDESDEESDAEENGESDNNEEEDKDEEEENANRNGDVILKNNIVTVADFLKAPTGEKLLLLQGDVVQDFVDCAKEISKEDESSPELKFVEEFTRIVMKVSSFCGSGYSDVRLRAENLTDALYFKLCTFAVENDKTSIWNNAVLVNLGLIKSEDKRSGKIDWNLEGCFKALEKVSQRDYFLQQIRCTLKFFLERPVKVSRAKIIDPFQESKDSLKAALSGGR